MRQASRWRARERADARGRPAPWGRRAWQAPCWKGPDRSAARNGSSRANPAGLPPAGWPDSRRRNARLGNQARARPVDAFRKVWGRLGRPRRSGPAQTGRVSRCACRLADVPVAGIRDEDALGHVGVAVAVLAGVQKVPCVVRGGTQVAAAGDEGVGEQLASFAGMASIRLPERRPSALRCMQQDQPAVQGDRWMAFCGVPVEDRTE